MLQGILKCEPNVEGNAPSGFPAFISRSRALSRTSISHSFRRTAAEILDEAALSARLVADELGHSRAVEDSERVHGPSNGGLAGACSGGRVKSVRARDKAWPKKKVRHRDGL